MEHPPANIVNRTGARETSDSFKEMSGWTATCLFFSVAIFVTALWVFLPATFQPAYRPDIIELQVTGKEWVWATRKHPMLPAWMLESINVLTNRDFAAPFLASQLCAFLTLWSVWALGRKVLSERLALIGTFALLPYWFFTIESVKFNQNIPLIALWSLSIFLVYRAFQTEKLRFWIGAGVTLGLAFHSKYSAAFLVIAILSCMTFRPEWRKYWKTPGPYVTTLIAFFIFLPHLIWTFREGFSTVTYAQTQYHHSHLLGHLVHPVVFLICEAGYLVLSLLVFVPVLGWRWRRKRPQAPAEKNCERYLFYCIGIPLGLHLLIAGIANVKLLGDYGAAFWPFLGIYLLLRFQTDDRPTNCFRAFRVILFLELLMICVFFVQSIFSPYLMGEPRRFHFPMTQLGTECERIWSSRFPTPCPYLSGDWWVAGNAACAMKDRPSVLFYFKGMDDLKAKPTGTWAEDADINDQGGMILWQVSEQEGTLDASGSHVPPSYIALRFPRAEVLPETLTLRYQTGADIPPLKVGVAVISPPKTEKKQSFL